MREISFTVKKEDEGTAIRKMLKKNFGFSSRLLAGLKAQKLVFLNDVPLEGYMKIKEGDVVRACFPDERSNFPPEDIPIDAIYEDEDLLIVNKQPGITVHPTKGHKDHTLANGLMRYMEGTGDPFKIRFVNRLDMDTSGILIVAKNSHAQDRLIHQMDSGSLEKEYLALVKGAIDEERLMELEHVSGVEVETSAGDPLSGVSPDSPPSFSISLPIGLPDPERPERAVMDQGKPCLTQVFVEEVFPEGYTLVRIRLHTGRTHQIRVHMSHIGHPLAGDPLYGGECSLPCSRQLLHAYSISFDHPVTGKLYRFQAAVPGDMTDILEDLRYTEAMADTLAYGIY